MQAIITLADFPFWPRASTMRSHTSDFPDEEPPATPMMNGKDGVAFCPVDAPEARDPPDSLPELLGTGSLNSKVCPADIFVILVTLK